MVAQTAQGARQSSIRTETGRAESYNGDWHALFDQAGISTGPLNGRMLAWINLNLGTSYTNLSEAKQALAVSNLAYNFSSMGAFSASSDPVAGDILSAEALSSTPPVTSPTNIINDEGWVLKVKVKDTLIGQSFTRTGCYLTVTSPGYDASGATTRTRTVPILAQLRMPAVPDWTSGQAVVVGDQRLKDTSDNCRWFEATSAGTCGVTAPTARKWQASTTYAASTTIVVDDARRYSTTAGGTSGTTKPTHTAGSVSDGGVTWTYVSDVSGTGGGISDGGVNWKPIGDEVITPTYKKMEVQNGADADIFLALEDYVYLGDTATLTMAAAAYGASRATRTPVTITNSSAFPQLLPAVALLTTPWQLVTTSIRFEILVASPYGQESRTAAYVEYRVVNGSGTELLAWAKITSMSDSTISTSGNLVQSFGATVDVSSISDGGPYYIEYRVAPFVGTMWESTTHGYGVNFPTSTSTAPANPPKRIPFRKDAAGTGVAKPVYVAVSPTTGNDGTGQANFTKATAQGAKFATISAAFAAAQTYSNTNRSANNIGNVICLLSSGTYVGFHGSSNTMPSRTKGDTWAIISRDPDSTSSYADVVISPGGSAALRQSARRVKFVEVDVQGSSSAPAIDNVSTAPGAPSEYGYETWFEGCRIKGFSGGSQRAVARMGLTWFTNTIFDSPGSGFGNDAFSVTTLIAGGTATATDALGTNCQLFGVTVVGIQFSEKAMAGTPGNLYGAEGQTVSFISNYPTSASPASISPIRFDYIFRAFNTWYTCKKTVSEFNSTDLGHDVGYAGVWMMSITESYNNGGAGSAKGGELSADGNIRPMPRFYHLFATYAGDGVNTCYNENGVSATGAIDETSPTTSSAVTKRMWEVGCLYPDRNAKADLYASGTPRQSQYKVGNWPVIYSVGRRLNAFAGATSVIASNSWDTVAKAGNLAGECYETTSYIPSSEQQPEFVNDQSALAPSGSRAGGGDYHPTSSSPFKGYIGATQQMFPKDGSGTTRATNGNGCPGMFDLAS